jgi:hypothetical protein
MASPPSVGMASLRSLAALLLTATTVWGRSIARNPVKRQSYEFINATQYNGTVGPVEVSVSLNSGARNQTSPLLYGWYVSALEFFHVQS